VPRGSDTSTDMTDLKVGLRDDLATCASKLDWGQTSRFSVEAIPRLKRLLVLEDTPESIRGLKDLLLRIRGEQETRERAEEPRFGRVLSRAWTILLQLDPEWEEVLHVTTRRQELMSTWRGAKGQTLESEDSFRQHQENKFIYMELADRILVISDKKADPPPPETTPKPARRSQLAPRKFPWPVRGHEPHADQEIVILVAAHAMRNGPISGLVKLVREFEPYWRATETMIYALEGSYREIWRAGLLHDYRHFGHLMAGSEGGLVEATEVVIAAAAKEPRQRTHVVYLIDPHDSSSLYPASASLKRECLLTHTPFLTSDRGAARWFRLEWTRRAIEDGDGPADDLLVTPPKSGYPTESPLHERSDVLALAAHDRHKVAMMTFAERHEDLIARCFPNRWATQATGHLLNGGTLSEGEYQDHILSDEGDERRKELRRSIDTKASEWTAEERKKGPGSANWIPQLTFGRQGGVIQLAGKVIRDECDTILFFEDAETAREHDTEIQVLDRAAQLAGSNCLLLHDASSADRWAENLEISLGGRGTSPSTTLIEAYRKIFDVELVLVRSATDGKRNRNVRRENESRIWERITAAAALHIVGALRAAAEGRSERDPPVRFGFHWGGAIRDILGEVEPGDGGHGTDRRALAGALAWTQYVDDHDTKELGRGSNDSNDPHLHELGQDHAFRPDELRVVPTVGVIGARDRSLEAHSLVERAVQILGGEAVLYPESAFALTEGSRDPWGGAPHADWENLDVLLLSAAPLQDRSNNESKVMATGVPADLAAAVSDCKGAVGTIYLEEHDGQVRQPKTGGYRQAGLGVGEIEKLKSKNAEIVLVNGAEENVERREAALAALKAELATTFVSDEAFAWAVLKEELARLKPPGRKR
jgi:methylglyoxal synthase